MSRVATIAVTEGQAVEQGRLLLALACPRERESVSLASQKLALARSELTLVQATPRPTRLAALQSSIDEQRALVKQLERDLTRFESLAERQMAAEQSKDALEYKLQAAEARLAFHISDYEEQQLAGTKEEVAVAQASVNVAEQELALAKASYSECEIRSPIAGQVLRIDAREGEHTQGQIASVTVADLTLIKVRVEVDERDAALVSLGDRADIWINGRSERSEGHVVSLAGVSGRRSARTFDRADRFDRDVIEADLFIDRPDPSLPHVIDLRVQVGFH